METTSGGDSAARDELRARIRGEVLAAGEAGYEEARAVWNARVDRRPALLARCTSAGDVAAGVDFARERGLPLSVRGGGHHVSGHALADGGLTLDLGPMDGIRVDPESRRARVGPGATVRELNRATAPHGLIAVGAPITLVGVAGYTLGGGLGWTSRAHGLACDNLVSAEVVTAAGERVRAAADENPDLYWGLRGGGGNFGVVTSFELRLHEVGPEVLAGPVTHPMEAAPEVLGAWRDFMAGAPDRLQCMPVVFPLPPDPGLPAELHGRTVFALFFLWAGEPARGREAIRPLRETGDPMVDDVGVVPYAGLLEELDEMYRAGHRNYYRSAFFDELGDDALATFSERVAPVPTPYSSAFLEPLGGAVGRVDPGETAFPHRERSFCVTAVPKWEDPARDAEMREWADGIFGALEDEAAPGVYANYLDEWADGGPRDAYRENWERLAELKRTWDPDNLFRHNVNVPPEGGRES